MSQTPMVDQNELTAVPAGEEQLYEIVDGEPREIAGMGAFETVLAWTLSHFMGRYALENKLGWVVTEALFVLDSEAKLQRRPDVAYVSYSRWSEPTVPRSNAWNVVPDLMVEVVSATNLAEEIDTKLTDYFNAGVAMVWVLFPDSGRVYVYTSPKQVEGLERTDVLDGKDVLPGFRLPIDELFQAAVKPE